jgi:YfiH family protein
VEHTYTLKDTMFHTHPFLQHPIVTHGFFGRIGGVSEGIYEGLNCGQGSYDVPAHVSENRRRVAAIFSQPPTQLCTLHQVHSPDVVIVDAPPAGERPKADALVTDRPNLVLGILTADCAPVLFLDPQAGIIGAAHAGWKGAYSGVIENTVQAMEQLGARRDRIAAAIGPCIAQRSYEVGAEFIARFEAADQEQYFVPSNRPDYHRFDLPGYVAGALRIAEIEQIAVLAMDTCGDEENFFSYRRATLGKEADYGRQISAICLKA